MIVSMIVSMIVFAQLVAADMINSSRPMDRLICGDVGFGKTEVAVRAIYRAVQSGKQVSSMERSDDVSSDLPTNS